MILILILLVSLLFVYFKILRRGKSHHFLELANKLPGPDALPILGNGLGIKNHPEGALAYLCEGVTRYGKVVRFWIGNHLYVYLTDPVDIEVLLKDTVNITKSSTYDFLHPWLGNGLVTFTGQHWHLHRKAITPAFHFNILEKFVTVFNEKGKILIQQLSNHVDGESFNIVPYISLYALDAIMETSMGLVINAQEDTDSKYVRLLERLKQIMTTRFFSPLLRQKFIFLLSKEYKEQTDILAYVNDYSKNVMHERSELLKGVTLDDVIHAEDDFGTQQAQLCFGVYCGYWMKWSKFNLEPSAVIIQNNRNKLDCAILSGVPIINHLKRLKKKRLTFLDLLLVVQKSNITFTDTDLLDEINTFLFAGHDTTTVHISFLMYALADNPEVQEKVYNEIVSIYGSQPKELSFKDVQETKYLDMVIKETLRLYSPIPSISRLLQTDLKLKNFTIPAGTSTSCFLFMLHRNPEIYPNPLVFDPERFSPENTRNRSPYAFVPFSAGLRNCIGQKYAGLETKLAAIELLWHYKVIKTKNLPNLVHNVVLSPTDGIHVRLERRASA